MATDCFKSWKISASFHTVTVRSVRLAKSEREALPAHQNHLLHTKTLLQDSYSAGEILKILKLKMIAPKSLYSTGISAHMRMRDTQTTQKKEKKTRMKQRDMTKKSIEMWHE